MSHVCVVASYAPSLINFRGHLLGEMVRRGHQVTTIAPAASREIRNALRELGVAYRDIGIERTGLNPFADLRYGWRLWRAFRGIRPDVVLSYTIKPNVYASSAARLASVSRIACLVTGLGFAFDSGESARSPARVLARALLCIAIRCSDVVICQNPDDLRQLVESRVIDDASKAFVVDGSGIDLQHFQQRPVPEGPPTFLLIARLLVNKGIREYAEAARLVSIEYPDVRFWLVGWFDDNPAALDRREFEEWQDQGIVDYHGSVEDVRPWLDRCCVYVLPSYREGTPRTVLEAMATGRAIVTTDVPGCRQTVLDGDNGFLVRARNVEQLAAAMKRFAEEPQLAVTMGARSRKLAEERFDVRNVSDNMLRLMRLD